MSTFTVEVKGLKELQRAFREYPKTSEPILQRVIVATQAVFAKYTIKDNPVPWRTGRLLQSFTFYSGRLQGLWKPEAKYAAFVEFGTRPHDIRPRAGRALRWLSGGTSGKYVTSKSGRQYYKSGSQGAYQFAMVVHHPGTKARPFMKQIARNATPEINKLVKQGLDMIGRAIANQTKI